MAIFARFAYAGGADVLGVLVSRFSLAGALLTLIMLATRRPWPRRRELGVAIAMGAVGYVGQAACFFSAISRLIRPTVSRLSTPASWASTTTPKWRGSM